MHGDRGSDLIEGDLFDVIALFLQCVQGMVTESRAFFDIIAVTHRDAVPLDSQAVFSVLPEICEEEFQSFFRRAFPAPVRAGREDLTLF